MVLMVRMIPVVLVILLVQLGQPRRQAQVVRGDGFVVVVDEREVLAHAVDVGTFSYFPTYFPTTLRTHRKLQKLRWNVGKS